MRAVHTPGPWMVDDEQEDRHHLYVRHVDSGRICQCFANCLVTTDAEVLGNARLIAAAPDMKEALEAFNLKEEWIVAGAADALVLRIPLSVIQKAAAALAKATGASS